MTLELQQNIKTLVLKKVIIKLKKDEFYKKIVIF